MRTHAEWNVETHIFSATGPTRRPTRSRISAAALLVNVMASTWYGEMRCSSMRCAMRCVRTRVLPEPAPATTSSGPPVWVTASNWAGFRPASNPSECGASGIPAPYFWPVTANRESRKSSTCSSAALVG